MDDVEDAGDPGERRDGEQREHEEKPPDTLHQQKLYVEVEAETRFDPTSCTGHSGLAPEMELF